MNDLTSQDLDSRDVLISRIVDGVASDADWHQFNAMADADASVWRALAGAQRAHAALGCAVADEVAVADRVTLPMPVDARSHRTRRFAGAGWLVAAIVALAWFVSPYIPRAPGPSNAAGVRVATPEEAMRAYLEFGDDEGSVLGEVPQHVLLQSRALGQEGGYEVIFVRQFVERARVEDLIRFEYARDETGRPTVSPASLRTGRRQWDG